MLGNAGVQAHPGDATKGRKRGQEPALGCGVSYRRRKCLSRDLKGAIPEVSGFVGSDQKNQSTLHEKGPCVVRLRAPSEA